MLSGARNREEYLLENLWQPQNWKAGSSTSGLLDYTFRNLTDQDLKFFEQLPTDGVLIGKLDEAGKLVPVFGAAGRSYTGHLP